MGPRAALCFSLLLSFLCLAGPAWPAEAKAPADEAVLENLDYMVDAWILHDAARVGIVLKRLGPGRFRVEASGEALGLAGLLSGRRRDNVTTEMAYRQGRLIPLVYREESRRRGKHYLKEYRFDYEKGRLEQWQLQGQELIKKGEIEMKEPIYDPLSAFYNCRLGLFGPLREGRTLKLLGIPYPKPEVIIIRIGPATKEGRKVMVSMVNRAFEDEHGDVFIFFDEAWTPTEAWSRVLHFGKIIGRLQSGSMPLKMGEMGLALGAGALRISEQGPGARRQ